MRRFFVYIAELVRGMRRTVAFVLTSTVSLSLFAGYAPASVKRSFEALYPNIDITEVIWDNDDDGYFLAKFQCDGFATRAWFDSQAQCVMIQTDIETMDRVPAEVYNKFASGSFSDYFVRDVTYVVFPKWQPIYVVLVGLPNLEEAYQLFYTPYGELLRERSTNGISEPLGIPTFFSSSLNP
jgi:hypothetical protein